ncbi:hypothetical protein GCM10018965_031200 [Nonomuraea roseola]
MGKRLRSGVDGVASGPGVASGVVGPANRAQGIIADVGPVMGAAFGWVRLGRLSAAWRTR